MNLRNHISIRKNTRKIKNSETEFISGVLWSESVSVGLRVNLFALSAISNFHCIEFECLKLLYRVQCAYGDSKELVGSYIFPIFKPFVLKIIPSFWIAAHNSFKTIANGRYTSKWLFRVVFFSLPQAVVGKRGKSNFPKCNTPVCSTCIWWPMARKSHCFCKESAFFTRVCRKPQG